MLKIAIATDWFSPRSGGIESQLLDLCERLGRAGHCVDVLTSTPGAVRRQAFRTIQLDVARVPHLDVAVSPRLLGSLDRLLHGYDVLHAHVSVVSPVGYGAAFVARRRGTPVVLTFHSMLNIKRYVLSAINQVANIGHSGVVWSGVSAAVAAQVESALGARTVVLPNGIDLPFWSDKGSDEPSERDEAIVLVSTMRLHRKKRPIPLLRAFAAAAARAPARARLLIAGDGPERAAVENAARAIRSHTAEVRVLGWQDRAALRRIYRNADGFVLASKHEAFGIAAVEARAAGLPVIALGSIGARETLMHDRDALFACDDEDLARQLERFISDATLRARLTASPASLGRYDWPQVIAHHQATYEHAMRASSRPAGAG